jgi:GNAT superfamily N-acetyltransferase
LDVPLTGTAAGPSFARSHGFTLANTEVHRVLELPLAESLLAELAAAAPATGYELVTWQSHCPDELVDAYAQLQVVFSEELPLGELEWSGEVWDAARIRAREAHVEAQGRRSWVTVAVSPDGSLAGHSELLLPTLDPGNVYQWDTLVVPAHRGHGLGLAMKVRNHAALQAIHPGPAVAHTWNAEQNDHMNAVNARLGYRPVELNQQWQRTV